MLFKWLNKGKNKTIELEGEPEEYLVEAIIAFENGQYSEAAELLIQIANAQPEHLLAHLLLARTLIQLNQHDQAVHALLNHLDIDPESAEAHIYLGLVYYDLNEIEQAEEAFEKATHLKRDSVLARENLAIARIQAGELREALDTLFVLHDENREDRIINELIVLALGKLGHWDAAKRFAKSHNTSMRITIEKRTGSNEGTKVEPTKKDPTKKDPTKKKKVETEKRGGEIWQLPKKG